jgi:CDP-diacylglycerol---serine O-phosphatidyltransferase
MKEHNRKNRKFRRGIYVLPTLFTIGTIFCGFYALINTLKGEFDLAAIAIGFAVVCDGLDGRIARLTNSCSEFGMQLDSLADVMTFGLAPAVLAYVWGLKALPPPITEQAKHIQQIGWIVCFAYVICGAMRLARFNIQSSQPILPGVATKKDFVGMPIPAGAGFVAAVIHFTPEPIIFWPISVFWVILVGFLSFLMVSTIRYPSFKQLDLRSRKSKFTIVLLALVVALIYLYSQIVLLLLATVYASSGLLAKLIHLFRHRGDSTHRASTIVTAPEDPK